MPAAKGKKKNPSRVVVIDAKDAKPASFPEQTEFEGDPNIVPRIPRLVKKAKEIANRRDRIKLLREEEKGLIIAAIGIMKEHELPRYSRDGVTLTIKESESLDVSVDSNANEEE